MKAYKWTVQSFYQIWKIFQPLYDCKIENFIQNGSKTNPSNNRPISLLPLISKIIKNLSLEQTSSFWCDNEILYNYQSNFRKNHSTNSCLMFCHDKILRSFNKNLMTNMILIDLQKAFVTIDLDILLKIEHYQFLKSYYWLIHIKPFQIDCLE